MAMRRALALLTTWLFMVCAPLGPAGAHPHEFIDTELALHFNARHQLEEVAVLWLWDDFTSMLMVEDMEMDRDGDGHLTPDEQRQMEERLGNWPDDFLGDLYIVAQGAPVALGRPQKVAVSYNDGRLGLSYIRAVQPRDETADDHLQLQVYDPTYYAYYELAGLPRIAGREGCETSVQPADRNAAQKLYDQLLSELSEEDIADYGLYPEVGGAFADMVTITCAAQP